LKLSAAATAALLSAAFVGLAHAQPGTHSALNAVDGRGTGFVEVSPTAMNEDGFTFDVQGTVNIHGAAPRTDFTVSRRPDLTPDGICTGSTWLTTGTLTTSAGGAGALHFEVQRGAPFLDGVRFDVMFRAVGTDGTVLESDCFTITVK